MPMPHEEHHHTHRSGWLRAAVLGANDGIVSTASLLLGFVAAQASAESVLLAGVAGVVAGTMAMAAGEYVSVSSQADTEQADLALERRGLSEDIEAEHDELAAIYRGRGLAPELAAEVARQLMARDALAAHARDELGISESLRARPLQAAASSGISFATGAIIPLLAFLIAPRTVEAPVIAIAALACLALLGALAARAGGAPLAKGAVRVLLWGALAMGITALVGRAIALIG
ncbi:MAG TPA: VIT family protein [Stellaceae bacterium]|jgi:VIT1/CCC1 family predicted Fe2+/Mn2+ transporter|nr:VIT family protein [Stellaceae bacterium]